MNHQAEPGGDGLDEDGSAGDSAEPAAEGTGPAAEMTGPATGVTESARPATGEPRLDAALTLLDRLAELPVTEHAAVFERVHAELSDVLSQVDPESAGDG